MISRRQSRSAISSRLCNRHNHTRHKQQQAKNKAKARTQSYYDCYDNIITTKRKKQTNYILQATTTTMSRINGSGGSDNAAYHEFATAFRDPHAPPQPQSHLHLGVRSLTDVHGFRVVHILLSVHGGGH